MLLRRLQKYSGSLYLWLTFKELISSLLDASVKLLRFLIKWKSLLRWKRFLGVAIVSLAFSCLLQKGKIFQVQEMQNRLVRRTFRHFIVKFIKVNIFDIYESNCHYDHRELPYQIFYKFLSKLCICRSLLIIWNLFYFNYKSHWSFRSKSTFLWYFKIFTKMARIS